MAFNETIQDIAVSYENASLVTQSPLIVTWVILAWAVPLLIYLLAGMMVKGRSPGGRVSSQSMIMSPNFWIGFVIFGLIQAIFLILLIFPIWLIPFS